MDIMKEITAIIEEKKLLEALPTGSGIDCEWEIIEHKNGNITAKNSFHAMDQYGYYDGYMDFSIKIFRHKEDIVKYLKGPLTGKKQFIRRKNDIDFSVSCNENRKKSFYGLNEYLTDTIHYSLSEAKITKNKGGHSL